MFGADSHTAGIADVDTAAGGSDSSRAYRARQPAGVAAGVARALHDRQ